jgi:hypothetical protein
VLTIRPEQLRVFARAQRESFAGEMCAHLRAHFAEETAPLAEVALRERVDQAIGDAAAFGLTSRLDCCRYLNIVVLHGWALEEWMKSWLDDPSIDGPSERLQRLADQCIRRLRVAEANRRLGEAFAAKAGGEP